MSKVCPKPKVTPLVCPKCGGSELRLIEDVTRYYRLSKATTAAVKAVADWPPDIDNDGENQRLHCSNGLCLHEWPILDGVALDWEDES